MQVKQVFPNGPSPEELAAEYAACFHRPGRAAPTFELGGRKWRVTALIGEPSQLGIKVTAEEELDYVAKAPASTTLQLTYVVVAEDCEEEGRLVPETGRYDATVISYDAGDSEPLFAKAA